MSSALFNGKPVESSLAVSRGLHYGDGVFRTMLWDEGRVLDGELHAQRLALDCRRLGLDVLDQQLLLQESAQLAAMQRRAVIKIILARASTRRGYAPEGASTDRLLSVHPAPQFPASNWTAGVDVFLSPVRLAEQPLLAGVKHLNRLEQVLASRDWPAGIAEAIVCDHAGRVIGGSRSNLFWVRQQRLHTPGLTRAGVDGMMKNRIASLAAAAGVDPAITDVHWHDLEQADEVFLSNSLIGIWPIRVLGSKSLTAPGTVTRRLMSLLAHPRLCA